MTSFTADLNFAALKVEELLAALASGRPAPAGGSAAALAGAMAAALVCMVAQVTIGREKYARTQEQIIHMRAVGETLQKRLTALAGEDAQAYLDLITGYSLPKATGADEAVRALEIQRALRRASEVPLETAEACGEVIELAAVGVVAGNRNAASDAACAALLAHAGLRCAALSVHTNLQGLLDQGFRSKAEARLDRLLATGHAALAQALSAAGSGD